MQPVPLGGMAGSISAVSSLVTWERYDGWGKDCRPEGSATGPRQPMKR